MNTIIHQRNNNSIYFIFLLSFIFHAFIFMALFLAPIKSLENFEKKTQNLIYMQIVSQPQTPSAMNKQNPEKLLPKKIAPQDPVSTKPSPKMQQPIEEKPINNPQINSA